MDVAASCPKCGFHSDSEKFSTCPKCGVVVGKYLAQQSDPRSKMTPAERIKWDKEEALRKELHEATQKCIQEEFDRSPAGQARLALRSGRKVFQIALAVSETKGSTVPLMGVTWSNTNHAQGLIIEQIEREGWRLENVGYVYRVTSSVSRDKLFSSGQQEAVTGEIIAIYLFRASCSERANQPRWSARRFSPHVAATTESNVQYRTVHRAA